MANAKGSSARGAGTGHGDLGRAISHEQYQALLASVHRATPGAANVHQYHHHQYPAGLIQAPVPMSVHVPVPRPPYSPQIAVPPPPQPPFARPSEHRAQSQPSIGAGFATSSFTMAPTVKDAEPNLPVLEDKDGLILEMDDFELPAVWKFKYRYWPNNKSRMYILETTGEFIKRHGLQAKDILIIYKNKKSGRYVARAVKAEDIQVQECECIKAGNLSKECGFAVSPSAKKIIV
ncbi:putative B3 domain-containing protein [Dichanthelium oligosanthes]|uniref:Putative B3 domain-containing protein n=1 Tax=Dichanthelium oligosanthes TaxID=888268 RepID=A0A1E5VB33_9POAL|nr:putative B3 domain-containing protein [Dichanthelium oligosanthes]